MRFLDLDRRSFLMMTAALGAGAAWRPGRARAQDRSVLRTRSYSDLQVLDPLNRLAQPEGEHDLGRGRNQGDDAHAASVGAAPIGPRARGSGVTRA